ncbi:hypothetical protein D9M72_121560 [compost metagenome]
MEHVPRARGIDDARARHVQRRQRVDGARLVVPEHAALAQGDGADAAAAGLEQIQQALRRQAELLAHALGADRHVDIAQQFVGVLAHSPAVQRGQHARLAAGPRVMQGGVGLVPVQVQGAVAADVQAREVVQVFHVARADDRALAAVGHDEGQGGTAHLARMQRHAMRRGHVGVHVPQPVGRQRTDQVGRRAQPRAGERGGDRVAAEGYGVVPRHALLVAGGPAVGQHGNVDIGMSDEERFAHRPARKKLTGWRRATRRRIPPLAPAPGARAR